MSNSTRLGRRGKATDPLPAGVADIAEQRQRTVANFPPSEAADLSDYLKRWRAGAPRRRAEEERAKNPPPGVLYARLRDKMPDDAVPDEGPRPEVDQGAYATSDPTAVVWTEQSLLGALMLGGDHFAAVDKVVHEQDFSRTEHQLVFSSMTKLNEGEQPIDATTVAQQLEDEQHLHKVGGVGYLADLVANTPGVMNVQVYAGKIRQAGNARRLSHEALEVSKAAHMSPEVRQAALAGLERVVAETPHNGLQPRSVAFNDMPEPPPVDWVCDNLMYRGGVYMHIGRPKSGKSTAARTLACGLSSSHETEGQPNQFFGRELATGNVVYIDYENPGRIAHHSFRGLREDGFDTRLLRLLLNEPSPISLLHGLEYIRAEANRHRPVLMVLDGLMGFARIEDLNDYAKVQPALQHLREFAVEFDCAVLLQHHGRKSGGFGGEQALGSVAIPGQVDGLLDFNFDNDGRHWVTSEALRHGEGIERTDVVMHGERMVLDEQASKRDYAQRQDERRHDLLAKVMEKGTATLSDFRTGFGRRESYRPMLEQMCRDGTLVQLGKAHDRTDPVRFAVA